MKSDIIANTMESIRLYFTTAGVNAFFALLTLIVGLLVIRWVTNLVHKWIVKSKVDKVLHSFIISVVRIFLIIFLAVSCAGMAGIDTTSIITALGAAGLAIGLSLQASLSNLAGGIFIVFTKPFLIGDYVEIDATGGTVTQIGLVHTILKTIDNKKVYVPNSIISNSKITNYSAEPLRRLDLVFSIGHGDDMEKAKEIIEKVVRQNPLSILEPAPVIRVISHSASSIDITCRVWVNTADYFNLYFDLHEQIKQAFDESGISIPYRQMDVHIINDQS